jgi:hypothetical protein
MGLSAMSALRTEAWPVMEANKLWKRRLMTCLLGPVIVLTLAASFGRYVLGTVAEEDSYWLKLVETFVDGRRSGRMSNESDSEAE